MTTTCSIATRLPARSEQGRFFLPSTLKLFHIHRKYSHLCSVNTVNPRAAAIGAFSKNRVALLIHFSCIWVNKNPPSERHLLSRTPRSGRVTHVGLFSDSLSLLSVLASFHFLWFARDTSSVPGVTPYPLAQTQHGFMSSLQFRQVVRLSGQLMTTIAQELNTSISNKTVTPSTVRV
jgi:hypothetical protein